MVHVSPGKIQIPDTMEPSLLPMNIQIPKGKPVANILKQFISMGQNILGTAMLAVRWTAHGRLLVNNHRAMDNARCGSAHRTGPASKPDLHSSSPQSWAFSTS